MRTQSSSEIRPLRRLPSGTPPTEESMRVITCSEGISRLKIATEARVLGCTAAYSAMLTARVDLPIEGRPATTTRSPGRRPPVILSKSAKPVASPRIESGLLCHSSIWSITCGSSALTDTAP